MDEALISKINTTLHLAHGGSESLMFIGMVTEIDWKLEDEASVQLVKSTMDHDMTRAIELASLIPTWLSYASVTEMAKDIASGLGEVKEFYLT